MENTRLVARLLSEVAAARAAITASYLRLWRSETGPPADSGGLECWLAQQDSALGSTGEEGSSDDLQ